MSDSASATFSDKSPDPDLEALPTGWPKGAPPLDDYIGSVPDEVIALLEARKPVR